MGNSSSTDVAEVFGHVAPALGDAASGIGDLCLETARDVFWGASPGNVHMVACALDYREDEEPASFTAAAGGLCSLAHACGVSSLEVLFNERATLLAVRRALQQVVSRCGRGDTFVFYFGGHCKTLRSYDLSRSVSKMKSNELKALCFVDGSGKSRPESWLRLDEFVRLVMSVICRQARVLVVLDCYGPCEAINMEAKEWRDQEVVTLASFSNKPHSNATFTESLLAAVERQQQRGCHDYPMASLYEACCEEERDASVSLQARPPSLQNEMRWPFIPQGSYMAPLTAGSLQPASASTSLGGESSTGPSSPATSCATVAAVFQQAVVHPEEPVALRDAGPADDPFCLQGGPTSPRLSRSSAPSPKSSTPNLYVLVCALDTPSAAYTIEGDYMVDLARHCNATHVECLFNESATSSTVANAVESLGQVCRPGDRFLLFYGGLGPRRSDGSPEAQGICLADDGMDESIRMSGESLTRLLTKSLPRETEILIVADCINPGAVADLGQEEWAGHRAILISGSLDQHAAEDLGASPGAMTRNLLRVASKLAPDASKALSVGVIYNSMLGCAADDGNGSAAIGIQATRGVSPFLTPWPLRPSRSYKVPVRRFDGDACSASLEAHVLMDDVRGLEAAPGAFDVQRGISGSPRMSESMDSSARVLSSTSAGSTQEALEPTTQLLPMASLTIQVEALEKAVADEARAAKLLDAKQGLPDGGLCVEAAPCAADSGAARRMPARMPPPKVCDQGRGLGHKMERKSMRTKMRKRDKVWQLMFGKPLLQQ